MSANPYEAPKTAVADYEAAQEFQEVKIWSASGRIGRLRYMAYGTGGWLVAGLVFGIFAAILDQSLAMLLAGVLYIAALVLSIFAAIQRSHDMDWSGWLVIERSRDARESRNVKKNFGANTAYLKSIFQ